MLTLINEIIIFLSNNIFLLTAILISAFLKLFLLGALVFNGIKSEKIPTSIYYLIGILATAILEDSTWFFTIFRRTFYPTSDIIILIFIIRIAWAVQLISYHLIAIFIEKLTMEHYFKKFFNWFFISITSIPITYLLFLAITQWNIASNRPLIEFSMLRFVTFYKFFVILPSIYVTVKKIKGKNFPKLLGNQLKIFLYYFILPLLLTHLIQTNPFQFSANYISESQALVSLSSILLTYAIYFCSKKIIHLRFLNFRSHVQSNKKFIFLEKLMYSLEHFSKLNNLQEIEYITQNFFKEAFGIPLIKTNLYIRKLDPYIKIDENEEKIKNKNLIENFLTINNTISKKSKELKIFIYDEIEFNNFLEKNKDNEIILQFLDTTNIEIFLPIYENEKISGYITIEKYSKPNTVYSNVERDEMLVFAGYLSNIIKLKKNRGLGTLTLQEKTLKNELYNKHQKINLIKESVKSFFNRSEEREIGIIFYKNRIFTYGNHQAKKLINIDLNHHAGHPQTKIIKNLITQVKEYNIPQKIYSKNLDGKKIILSAFPIIEQNNIIILIYYPEIQDIIVDQLNKLKNANNWDYLIFLESTKAGKLINKMLPSQTETVLNYKIALLKAILKKEPIWLSLHNKDTIQTLEIIQDITNKETLHILELNSNSDNTIEEKIFGNENSSEPALLEKLDKIGILYIQNIELLSLETQEKLAKFIRYNQFKKINSDQILTSDVRIICYSNQNLQLLIKEKHFSKELYEELKNNSLYMPQLITLPEEELFELISGIADNLLKKQEFKKILEITENDKFKIAKNRPASLVELKSKIQQIISKKTKKNNINEHEIFQSASNTFNPELVEIAKLGKHALKDPQIMSFLWNKFKNQNKIANFLGVNRSSVNRRCKQNNLN